MAARGKLELVDEFRELGKSEYELSDSKMHNCIDRAAGVDNLEMVKELIKLYNIDLDYSKTVAKSLASRTIIFSKSTNVLSWWFDSVKSIPTGDGLKSVLFRLMSCCGGSDTDVIKNKIKYLIEKGGDYSLCDHENVNVFMQYVKNFGSCPVDKEFVKLMLSNKLKMEQKNIYDQNICHYAAADGKIHVLNAIAEHLTPNMLNLIDIHGYKPITYAIANGHTDTVKWLLNAGAERQLKIHSLTQS